MQGLERIDILVHVDSTIPELSPHEPWVQHMLTLLHGPNGLRQLKLHVYSILALPNPTAGPGFTGMFGKTPQAKKLEESLKHVIDIAAETYKWNATYNGTNNQRVEVSS